jgi:hypothetical protein
VEQYFGLRHLPDRAYQARFTTIVKNIWDTMCRQILFNMFRGSKLLVTALRPRQEYVLRLKKGVLRYLGELNKAEKRRAKHVQSLNGAVFVSYTITRIRSYKMLRIFLSAACW